MNYVQAYISNISFPNSLDEVYNYAHFFNMEAIIRGGDDGEYEDRETAWTAPKWCKKGDIVFFMHAKYANSKISKLKNELLSSRERYSNSAFWTIMNALIRAKKIHEIYGGKNICNRKKYLVILPMKKWIMRICIGEVIYMRQLMIFFYWKI